MGDLFLKTCGVFLHTDPILPEALIHVKSGCLMAFENGRTEPSSPK